MQKFQFRFATVQRIRKIERDQQSRILAVAMQGLAKIREEIVQLEREHQMETLRMRQESLRETISSLEAQISLNYRAELRNKVRAKRKEEEAALFKVEQERLKLVDKEKLKKVLDKLEERDREKYETDLRKFESQEMDELASVRQFARDSREKQSRK